MHEQPGVSVLLFIGHAGKRLSTPLLGKIGITDRSEAQGTHMSAPTPQHEAHEADAVEKIVPLMPIVLPVAGGILIFLLAFIAVFMA